MSNKTSIIITEDERSFVMRFKLIMQKTGIPMQGFKHFTNSEDAIQYYREKQPGIVFLDLNLKGSPKNGMEILEYLKKKLKAVAKVGIISTSDNQKEIDQCKALGGNFYIVKTGKINEFETRLRDFKKHFIDGDAGEFMIFGK